MCCCNAHGNTAARKAHGAVEIASVCNLGPGRGRHSVHTSGVQRECIGMQGSSMDPICGIKSDCVSGAPE